QALLLPLLKALRSAPACLLAREELPGLPDCPFAVCEEVGARWIQPPDEAARRFLAGLEQGAGIAEPLQRAEAALRYVIEYETGPARRAGAAGTAAPWRRRARTTPGAYGDGLGPGEGDRPRRPRRALLAAGWLGAGRGPR